MKTAHSLVLWFLLPGAFLAADDASTPVLVGVHAAEMLPPD